MVCSKCEAKLSKVVCAEKWKANQEGVGTSSGRKINENKALSAKKRWQPYAAKCTLCKSPLQPDYKYCQKCAYVKGVCAMCGKQVLDTKGYKQSTA